jgi:phosphatidate cytidylyltransferase
MDDQRRSRPEDDPAVPPAEGVRIIGPDEAAEVMERDDVAPRRTDDQLRFGDRPPKPPAGPRPTLRFPLDASADPTRIERPPVQPAPDPVTGPVELPHWTEPPTGEVPAVLIGDDSPLLDDGEDLDAWSSFATSTPRWRDADDDWEDDGFMQRLADDGDEARMGALGGQDDPSHEAYFGFDDLEERTEERTGDVFEPAEPAAPYRSGDDDWSAGTEIGDDDWSAGTEIGDDDPAGGRGDDEARADGELSGSVAAFDRDDVVAVDDDAFDDDAFDGDAFDDDGYEPPHDDAPYDDAYDDDPGGDRDMTTAIAVGGGMALVAAIVLIVSPAATAVLVSVILTVAAIEYFDVLRKVGWESARAIGVASCTLLPLAVYWRGALAYPLIAFVVVVTVLIWYLAGAGGRDPRVLEGSGATLLGVFWIGGLGSTAAALVAIEDGTALLLYAILATVAYDVAGLLIGRSMGHRPLTAVSPHKTLEGLVGGIAAVLVVAIVVIGIIGLGPWTGAGAMILLGVGAAIAAPLGDLCQSLIKRDLGEKDMGTLLPGHGGVLDRFDSMLFVLPTVFWLAVAVGSVG